MTFSFSVWVHDINTLLLRANPTDFLKKIFNVTIVTVSGHTHTDIDQMFSCFSRALAKYPVYTTEQLIERMHSSYGRQLRAIYERRQAEPNLDSEDEDWDDL